MCIRDSHVRVSCRLEKWLACVGCAAQRSDEIVGLPHLAALERDLEICEMRLAGQRAAQRGTWREPCGDAERIRSEALRDLAGGVSARQEQTPKGMRTQHGVDQLAQTLSQQTTAFVTSLLAVHALRRQGAQHRLDACVLRTTGTVQH